MTLVRKIWTRCSSYVHALQEKNRLNRLGARLAHTDTGKSDDDDLSRPIQYSTSNAATWKAQYTRSGRHQQDYPWFQSYVISGSLSVFLLYFCVLREENDIDGELKKSLYDRIPGLEEKQLQVALEYASEHGHNTSAIAARLEELDKKKAQV